MIVSPLQKAVAVVDKAVRDFIEPAKVALTVTSLYRDAARRDFRGFFVEYDNVELAAAGFSQSDIRRVIREAYVYGGFEIAFGPTVVVFKKKPSRNRSRREFDEKLHDSAEAALADVKRLLSEGASDDELIGALVDFKCTK